MSNLQELNDALAGNYMLVSVSFRSWSGKRTDADATQEVIKAKSAVQKAGSFVTYLLAEADDELKAVHAAAAMVRQFVYSNTLPWSLSQEGARRGERLIPTAQSMVFLRDLNALKKQHDDAVLALEQVWPQRVAQASSNLGGLAATAQYPDASELRKLFGITVELRPMPVVSDFARLNVPAAMAEALGERMAQQAKVQVESAMDDLRERLTAELNRMHTQLSKAGNGEKTRLYETLITNTQQLCAMARTMNLTNNQKLIDVANKIESSLLKYPIETLREDKTRALEVAAAAAEVIGEIDGIEWF